MTITVYQHFLDSLYEESPRAAWAFEAVKFNLMARTGLDEGDALEVVSKCLAFAGCTRDPARHRIQPYPIRGREKQPKRR